MNKKKKGKLNITNPIVLKAILEKAYHSSLGHNQLEIFFDQPSYLKINSEKLFGLVRSLIHHGYNPVSIYLAVSQLNKDGRIFIYPAYQFTTIDEFLKIVT
jgi:hypothetical protein